MSMQIGGPRTPDQIGQAGGVSMNVREYFNACKNETMSTPKAVLSAIKYAFSSQTGKQEKVNALQQQQQNAPTQQVASQRAAEPNNAPKFTTENTLSRAEWENRRESEYRNHGRDPGTANSPKEAAQNVMKELQSQFPDHVIEAVGDTPIFGHSESLVFGVVIRPKDDEYGERRCISFLAQTNGAATSISSNQFLQELNRLNQ
ncbi:MAG: hypothetical protein JSR37_05510 [Verrucomicrobia bacterium]|nr:hypothetical protein [Verrucomicrobiota bacterium]MBS0637204.1 hypothetical protein [Verrucomicrobiota bacterium]